jgi:outer membrane protein TolC
MYRFVFAILLAALAAPAQPTTPTQPTPVVRLNDLVAEALQHNRDILAAQKKVEASQARRSVVSSLPDPTVTFGYMNATNPVPFSKIGSDPLSYAGVAISQELPFNGKLKLRGEIAQKDADADFQLYQAAQLAVVGRVKLAYYALHHATVAQEILLRNKDLLQKFARIAEARYSVGKGVQQDVLKAQMEVTRLEARRARLDQEEGAAVAEINALLNRPPGTPLGRPEDLRREPLKYTLEELYARAQDQSPVLRRDQVEVEKNTLAMNLARRDYYPDFGVMGAYWNYGRYPNMFEARFDVKVPLYFWRKQRSEVKEQASNVAQARHQYEATSQMLNFQVKDDYLAALASDKIMDIYEKAVMKQAALTLESSMSSYETGAVDFLTLLTNLMTVLDTELTYHEELANYHKALARLEAATGLRLTQ